MSMVKMLVFALVAGIQATGSGQQAWVPVPAAGGLRFSDAVGSPTIPMEDEVRIIGKASTHAPEEAGPRPVFSVEWPRLSESRKKDASPPASLTPAIPSDALWPDDRGLITADHMGSDKGPRKGRSRNPWEVREGSGTRVTNAVFTFKGIISGGEGGPVAILNGRVVRRGDAIGDFRIASVHTIGVVLERNGCYFVIPIGKPTTILAAES